MRAALVLLALSLALPAVGQEVELLPGTSPVQTTIEMDPMPVLEGAVPVPDAEPAEIDGLAEAVAAQNAAARPDIAPKTLADMQADLRAVAADLQALRAELLASGAPGFAAAGGDSAIDRMNAMEARLAQLTDLTERLARRIERVVADGSNRVGDIEFRLCELDEHCDLGALMTADLGAQGGAGRVAPGPAGALDLPDSEISSTTLPPLAEPAPDAAPPTEAEARKFTEARAEIEAGRWSEALTLLDAFVADHAGAPLTAEALFLRGVAHQALGQVDQAAASWLQGFAAAPDGDHAPANLMALARAAQTLGAPEDACPYLGEMIRRFPDAPEAAEAQTLAESAGCGLPGEADGQD